MQAAELYDFVILNADKFDDRFLNCDLIPSIKKAIDKEEKRKRKRGTYSSAAVKRFLGEGILKNANKLTINDNEYYVYTDGYKLAWSPINYGFDKNEINTIYLESLIPKFKNPEIIPITDEMRSELSNILKTHKVSKNYGAYTIKAPGGKITQVNPEHLKACMDFTGAKEMIVDIDGYSKPVLFHGDNDHHALLLPVTLFWMEG